MDNKKIEKLERLDVEKVFMSDKKKDGTPITDFKNRPAKKVSLKTKQYPDNWVYSYPIADQDDPIFQITANTSIEAMTWEFNGFINFKLPTRVDLLEARIKRLEGQVFGDGDAGIVDISEEELEDSPF